MTLPNPSAPRGNNPVPPTLVDVLALVKAFIEGTLPGEMPISFWVEFASGRKMQIPVPLVLPPSAAVSHAPKVSPADFEPSDNQCALLVALEGKALRSDPLAASADVNRRKMFGDLKELKQAGLVEWSKKHGYYRPDCPPPELAEHQ